MTAHREGRCAPTEGNEEQVAPEGQVLQAGQGRRKMLSFGCKGVVGWGNFRLKVNNFYDLAPRYLLKE